MAHGFAVGRHAAFRCKGTSLGRGLAIVKSKPGVPPSQPPTFLIDARLIATMGLMESNFTFPEPVDIATNGLVDFEY